MMHPNDTVVVFGASGMVGSAIVRKLVSLKYRNLLTPSRQEVDLLNGRDVATYLHDHDPRFVFHAAGEVGGIEANSIWPATFLHNNLQQGLNILRGLSAYWPGKLLLLGSSCVYPRHAPQPIVEEALMTGPLEPTNEAYAIAKIAIIKLGQAFYRQYGFRCISLMPPNLYGPGDNYDLDSSHVVAALIRRFHEAKVTNAPRVEVWGTGKPVREVMYVDDAAAACLHMMQHYDHPQVINVGSGQVCSITELADRICAVVGYEGDVVWDTSKPDGTPVKCMDSSRAHTLGWTAAVPLQMGLTRAYDSYLETRR